MTVPIVDLGFEATSAGLSYIAVVRMKETSIRTAPHSPADAVRFFDEQGHEVVPDVLVDDETGSRDAGLAGGDEGSESHAVNGGGYVCVLEDDDRGLRSTFSVGFRAGGIAYLAAQLGRKCSQVVSYRAA